MSDNDKTTIGRAEKIVFLDLDNLEVTAKVDTGADRSSIWASEVEEKDSQLSFVLFGKQSDFYTGKKIVLPKGSYKLTRVENSFGQRESRYVANFKIKLGGRVINASFTLANRQNKTYPILIGRRMLRGKYIVDVSKGQPLRSSEKQKSDEMTKEIKIF